MDVVADRGLVRRDVGRLWGAFSGRDFGEDLSAIKNLRVFSDISIKLSTASWSALEVLERNPIPSMRSPLRCENSTSGMKSPSPETNTATSILGSSWRTSMAMPTSQSPFFCPPAKVWSGLVLTSNP